MSSVAQVWERGECGGLCAVSLAAAGALGRLIYILTRFEKNKTRVSIRRRRLANTRRVSDHYQLSPEDGISGPKENRIKGLFNIVAYPKYKSVEFSDLNM